MSTLSRKTRVHVLIVSSLLALLVASLPAQETAKSRPTTASQPTSTSGPTTFASDGRPIHVVRTADEFVRAIGPDRVIQIQASELDMGSLKRYHLRYVQLYDVDNTDDQGNARYELWMRKLSNVRIEGLGAKRVRLVTTHDSVLNITGCKDIEFANIEFAAKGETLDKAAFYADTCDNLTFANCAFVRASPGVELDSVEGLKMVDCEILNCDGIVTAVSCDDLTFSKCSFISNRGDTGFDLDDVEGVRLADCEISDNKLEEFLFGLVDSKRIVLESCTLQDNTFKAMADVPEAIKQVKVKWFNNKTPDPEPTDEGLPQ